jgi:hypothetical protein
VKSGMVAVLAMSYKISVSAVSLFTSQFYEAFLRQNLPFARAAKAARQAMRTKSQRAGRFGMLVELEDWMVPVVYCSTDSDGTAISESTVSRVHQRLPFFFRRTSDSLLPEPTELDGRDADILRLEERLFENMQDDIGRLIFLDGPNGIGKTLLLRHLQWWWASTGMITCSIYVNMNGWRDKSLGELCDHLISQLGGNPGNDANDGTKRLQVQLQTMSRYGGGNPSMRHPEPLLIFDQFFSTDWPLGKRETTAKGVKPLTWKYFFEMLSKSQVYTIVASHRWPWILDTHETSEFPPSMLYVLAPVVLNRADLALRTGGDQTLAGLIKGQNDIESLDLILSWCGPDLGLLNIILPLVGRLGAAKTAAMLTRGDDLLVLRGFPRRLLKRLPMWRVSKIFWKNAPKSLKELLIAFAPFHGYLPRCYEAYCVEFVLNKRALTHPIRNYFAKRSPETAKVWDQRIMISDLTLLVKHLHLFPILKSMGLFKADLMMGKATMHSGLFMGSGCRPEGTMLHSIHPVFSLFLRHQARKAGYLPSKKGVLSREAICLEKTFVDYHEKRIEELVENVSTVGALWDRHEAKLCRLSFTTAMEIHLRSPMDRFRKIHPTPGFLIWSWIANGAPWDSSIVKFSKEALSRCQRELAKTTDVITEKDIAIAGAQIAMPLAIHYLLTNRSQKFISQIRLSEEFLGDKYFMFVIQSSLDSLWPERALMLEQLNILKRIQSSIESNECTELSIIAEMPSEAMGQSSIVSQGSTSKWDLMRRALKITESQLQLQAKSRTLEFWDSKAFFHRQEVLNTEIDEFLTDLSPAWPELLSSCDSELLLQVRTLGFDEADDEIGIPDSYWDDLAQELLKDLPPMPNYASKYMASIRNGTPPEKAEQEFSKQWQSWTQSHTRTWVLRIYDISLQMNPDQARMDLNYIQMTTLSHTGDWALVLEHQDSLLVLERARSFRELSSSQVSRRISWHITTAFCALQLSRWDLCHDNLRTILELASGDGYVDIQRHFHTLALFTLLQIMAPPGELFSMTMAGTLYGAMILGYKSKGVYARNGALLSLILNSALAGQFAGGSCSSAGLTEVALGALKRDVQAHLEHMLVKPTSSSPSLDPIDLEKNLATIKESQHSRSTFPHSEAFCRRLQHHLNEKTGQERVVMAEAENHLCQHSAGCGCLFDLSRVNEAAEILGTDGMISGVPVFDLQEIFVEIPPNPRVISIALLAKLWFAKTFGHSLGPGFSDESHGELLQYLGQWHEAARNS